MTMTDAGPHPYEVWRLSFFFEDQPDVRKERPAIVAVVNHTDEIALVVKVTGHGPRPEFPGEIRISDWKEAGLTKPSTARCSKTMTVPLMAFQKATKYGSLTVKDAVEIEDALRGLGIIA